MAFQEEVILPFPSPVIPAKHARSTIIIGSCSSVRDAGKWEAYLAALPKEHHDLVLNAVAGTWIPVDIALAHYRACEMLGFSVDEQVANGRATFDRTSGTLLGTAIRMAREVGVTPWKVFPYYQRFYERGYDGGGVRIVKVGPKEAILDVVQVKLCESRYYRNALRGLVCAVTELFCTKAYFTERSPSRVTDGLTYRIQWA